MSVSKAELLRVLKATRVTADTRYGVTVEKQTTAETGYASTYVVKQNGTQVGAKINIPKDFLVKSAEVKTVTAADKASDGVFENNANFAVDDTYIDFVINTVDASETAQHIYLNVNELVDVYTAGNGIDITSNEISVVVDSNNARGLSVTANGLALAAAVASTSGVGGSAGAMTAADKEKLDGIAAGANAYTHPTLSGGSALTGVETADVTPAFGGTVSISQVATDTAGHVTSLTTRTITIPSAVAVANVMSGDTITTAGSAGLMSAADKTILDSLQASADETITDQEIAAIFVDD